MSLQVDKHVAPLLERGERVQLVEERSLAVDDLVGLMLNHRVHQRVLVGKVVVKLRVADMRGGEDVFVAGAGYAVAEHQLRCGFHDPRSRREPLAGEPPGGCVCCGHDPTLPILALTSQKKYEQDWPVQR